MLGMCYGDLMPVLIQSIKELNMRIQVLEGKKTKRNTTSK